MPDVWPSLADERDLATALFGAGGRQRLQAWLAGEMARTAVEHRGHGYAAHAQAYWAAHLAPDQDRLLIGTVDRFNAVSRRTAEAAGRARVLDMVFLSLGSR